MNDHTRRPVREALFEVFRPQGERDESAENYLLKKPTAPSSRSGPLIKNQIHDTTAVIHDQRVELSSLHLSGADVVSASDHLESTIQSVVEDTQPLPAICLETFSISMEQRLAAMQVAQQQAKDQLNEFAKQVPSADEPPLA